MADSFAAIGRGNMARSRHFSDNTDPLAVSMNSSALESKRFGQEFPIPTSPVIMAGLRAIYAGGPRNRWFPDTYGRPRYRYDARDGRITFFLTPPPDFGNRFHISKAVYYVPRLAFIHAGSLRAAVQSLSVETADVFLILMAKIARLRDPAKDVAMVSLEEIADFRGVHVRHGSVQNLHRDFKNEVHRLADLCLTMQWRDYTSGGSISFGKEIPDRLFDIVDVEYKKKRDAWTSFRFRCGQALSHFLSPEGLRWIGYYNRALLQLSPYHEAFTKKLGTYWTLLGIISGKKGLQPRATPCTILDFCGEEINWRNPGKVVDSFVKAHDRLTEIGVLKESDFPEPLNRTRGYFKKWLESPITVTLSPELWHIREDRKSLNNKKKLLQKQPHTDRSIPAATPEKPQDIIDNPILIRKFRSDYFLRQRELARALGIKRQTLSNYERGVQSLPEDTAARLIQIIRQKSELN